MTAASTSHLSQRRLQRLLEAVGSNPGPVEPDVDAVIYDWRDPHYFNDDQRNRLAAIMTQVAALLSDRFVHFYKDEFNVKATSIAQYYAADLASLIDSHEGFSLSFGPTRDDISGFLVIPTGAALDWATRLLGDSETNDDPERSISSLEESLLSDLLGAMTETFLAPLTTEESLVVATSAAKGCPVTPYEPTDEVTRVVFEVRQGDAEEAVEMSFVLPCYLLAPAVGKPLALEDSTSPEQLRQRLIEHVHQMTVSVTARLATTRLRFAEVLDLSDDDILLINKPIDEPVDVVVDDRIVFRGRPTQSDGQFTVYITESTAERTDKTATPSDGR